MNNIHNLQLQIIKNCILYFDGEYNLKETILSDLKEYSKHYHTRLVKMAKIDKKVALIRFIDNLKGADYSINILINSL